MCGYRFHYNAACGQVRHYQQHLPLYELHFLTIKQAFTEAELALSKRAEEQVLHQKALKLELSGEKIKNLNTQLLMERNRSKFNRISRRQKSTHETCGLEDLAFTVKFFIND
ncbi:uncharacterized protein LOC144771653 isoform X2 [Lissotriton helveticus]